MRAPILSPAASKTAVTIVATPGNPSNSPPFPKSCVMVVVLNRVEAVDKSCVECGGVVGLYFVAQPLFVVMAADG